MHIFQYVWHSDKKLASGSSKMYLFKELPQHQSHSTFQHECASIDADLTGDLTDSHES